MAYSAEVLDRFENPTHVGSLDKSDLNVGTGLVGAPACGDVLKIQIQVDPETDLITAARFKAFGCGSALAASQLACEMMEGKSLTEAEQLKNSQLAEELALPPVKIHCSVLAEDAIKAAIEDFRRKQRANHE